MEGARRHHPGGQGLVGPERTRATGTSTPTRRSAGGWTGSRTTSRTGRRSATPRRGSRPSAATSRAASTPRRTSCGPTSVDDFAAYLVGRRRAAGEGARHQVRHARPPQRAEHELLGHQPRLRPASRSAAARKAPTSAPSCSRRWSSRWPRRSASADDRRRHRAMDETNPATFASNWNSYSAEAKATRRAAQRPHLRHRPADGRPGHRQGRGQAAVDERGRGHLGTGRTSRAWSPASAWPSTWSTTCASWSPRHGCSGSPSRTTTT